jgi:hypothetical protein
LSTYGDGVRIFKISVLDQTADRLLIREGRKDERKTECYRKDKL